MSKLLIQEPPLQVLPTLAVEIGLNEAIVLQQIHYWMRNKNVGKIHDGKKWVRNTYTQWKDNFPFWSERTIRRTINSLEERNILLSTDEINLMGYDQTKWYTINYGGVDKLSRGGGQNGQVDEDKMSTPIPETTPETTPEMLEEEGKTAENVFKTYEQEIEPLTAMIGEQLNGLEEEHTAHWVCEAIKIASKNGKRYFRYVDSILNRWRTEGYGTVPSWEREHKTAVEREDEWAAGMREVLEE